MQKFENMVGKIFPTNNGGDCVVVEYVNCSNVTVQFLDKHRGVVKTRTENLKKGLVRNPNKMNLEGQIFRTEGGTDCIVLEYKGYRDITVQFLDENKYVMKTHLRTLKRGGVKNPFDKTVYGIGFIGLGKHIPSLNGKDTKVYKLWASVICRTYHEYSLNKFPTYRDVEICDEWLNFQNFADWCFNNPFYDLGYCLDKDFLSDSNKVYSPDTCCFIPHEINTLLLNSDCSKNGLPTGVTERGGKYRAKIARNGKKSDLGTYNTVEEAYKAYVEAKESYVKEVAYKWEGKIDNRIFKKLITWKIN